MSLKHVNMFSFAILEGLEDLCSMVKENLFLERKDHSEGYRDHKGIYRLRYVFNSYFNGLRDFYFEGHRRKVAKIGDSRLCFWLQRTSLWVRNVKRPGRFKNQW